MNLETNPRSDSIETSLLEEGGVHNGEDSFLVVVSLTSATANIGLRTLIL